MMNFNAYQFYGDDARENFRMAVTRLVAQEIEDFAKKSAMVTELTEEYIAQSGERPDYRELDELASWLLFGPRGLSLRKRKEIQALRGDA